MDETTKKIIAQITISRPEGMKLPTGGSCTTFYDCVQLTPNDLARLAAQATGHLPDHSFDLVLGLAYSGIFFAAAVAGGRQVAILQKDGKILGPALAGKKVVIADDVVHLGSALEKARKIAEQQGGKVVGYACIVDRSEGQLAKTITPLWSAFQTDLT